MTVRVGDLPPCTACGGRLLPLVLCAFCGSATILRDAQELDRAAVCSECGSSNPWQLICDQCHSRFPAPKIASEPSSASQAPESKPEIPNVPPGRPKRRIRGELDAGALLDLLKSMGLDPSRSRALLDRGYDALWKIARATYAELARIPEVGPVAARKVVASIRLLHYSPPQRTGELIAQEEYECPLCRCVTSAFARACLECGAAFNEEEMDETIRREFTDGGDASLLAFFDRRLAERPDDSDVLYARSLLLEALGRVDEAIDALDRAAAKAPDVKKIKVAQLRMQTKRLRHPDTAEKLRSTATAILEGVAWDQEVAQLGELLSADGPTCPQCQAAIPQGAAMCPSCGMRLSGVREASAPEPEKPALASELDTVVDDLLVGELEQSLTPEELERTQAAVVDWLIAEIQESMAPLDTLVASLSERPHGTEAPPKPSPGPTSGRSQAGRIQSNRGLVSGLRPARAPPGIGRVNGVVNGQGRVNGLVNDVGRTSGLVNGVSRVNGLVQPAGRVNGLGGGQGRTNGMMNGTRFVRSPARVIRRPLPSRRIRYAAIVSSILVAILIGTFLFLPNPGSPGRIVIDGSFGDWASEPMFDAATIASDANVSIVRYSDVLDNDSHTLYLYASTAGGMFGDSSQYDGVYFLIDADGNASTGLSFDGIGADAVVEVFGANHNVDGAGLYSFPVGAEFNWSQRQPIGSPEAAASGRELEVAVSTYDIARFDPLKFRISVYGDNFRGSSSRSKASLTAARKAVLLQVQPLSTVVGSGLTAFFEIRIHALGIGPPDTWQVSNFIITSKAAVSLSAESVNLTQGRTDATITAFVSASGFFSGDVVQANLTGATLSGAGSSGRVFVRAEPVRGYVIAPPSTVRVDGLFADWVTRDVPDTDPRSVNDSSLDIVRSGAATSNATAFFHVQVAGALLSGGLPRRITRLPPGTGNGSSGGSAVLPRQTGEDLLLIYVDSNASNSQGLPIGGIVADYLVEIRGEGGEITSKTLYAWSNRWIRQGSVLINAMKNETDIEASVHLPSLNNTRMVFESTDWSSAVDWTAPIGAPSFAPSPKFAVGTRSLGAPQTNGFAGATFYLRATGPLITPSDCSIVKGLNTTQGSSGTSLNLSSSPKACFFTDPEASPETVPAGLWSTSMDLSTATGSVLNVTFAITQLDGSLPALICWRNTSTNGGVDQVFSCSGNSVSISANQRIRLRVQYVSGPPMSLSYDGSATSAYSSTTLPVPEFGEAATPLVAVGILSSLIFFWRRRRTS